MTLEAASVPAPAAVDDRIAGRIEEILVRRIADDTLALPLVPGVASRVSKTCSKQDVTPQELITTLESDPMLSAFVLRAASGDEPCTSVFRAVARLGVVKLRTRLHELVSRQTLMSGDKAIAKACQGVWEHAIAVAIVARELAILTNSGDGDDAYAAGLLHDVGKPIVATMLLDAERSSLARPGARWVDVGVWINVVQRVHRGVATALAERWQLAPPIQSVVRQVYDYDSSDRLSIANAVRFANSFVKLQGFAVGPVSRPDEEAIILIGRSLLGVEDDVLPKLGNALRTRVQQQLGW